MIYDPKAHHRRSIRIKGHDYSEAGPYFVTVCAHNRKHLFGQIISGEMQLSEAGKVVAECRRDLVPRFQADLDEFVIMPNHLHGIILIVGAGLALPQEGAASRAPTSESATPKRPSLPDIIGAFKSLSTIRVNRQFAHPGRPLWQHNYYEHIIRDEPSLNRIREYIQYNPLSWSLDRENPERQGEDAFDRWLSSFKTRPEKGKIAL